MKNFRARLLARRLFWKNFRPQNPLFLRHFHGKILGTGKILGPTLYLSRVLIVASTPSEEMLRCRACGKLRHAPLASKFWHLGPLFRGLG